MIEFGESVQHLYLTDLAQAVLFYTGPLGFVLVEQHQMRPEARMSLPSATRRTNPVQSRGHFRLEAGVSAAGGGDQRGFSAVDQ